MTRSTLRRILWVVTIAAVLGAASLIIVNNLSGDGGTASSMYFH